MPTMYGLARLGRDCELRYTADGKPVASLSLAFNYGRKDDSGKRPTTWVDAALWDKRAEQLAEHLRKGTSLVVTLRDVHIETFDKRDGGQGSKIVATVADLEFAGPPPDAALAQAPAPRQAPARAPAAAPRPAPKSNTGFDDMDDDIPF